MSKETDESMFWRKVLWSVYIIGMMSMMGLTFFEQRPHAAVKLVKHVSTYYGTVHHNKIEKKS